MISIAMRLRPFSHRPGTVCMIPKTEWQLQAFPALLRFTNLVTFQTFEQRLEVESPVSDFTVMLDLEKGGVRLLGDRKSRFITEKDLPVVPLSCIVGKERLSLGMHKQLDWDLVVRRKDLCEILPVWFRLGQMVPIVETPKVGTAKLLTLPEKLDVKDHFLKLFLAGFRGILAPRLSDDDHQGIVEEEEFPFSPLGLLSEGTQLIRSLFFQEKGDVFSFLPHLPPQFHAGRLVSIQTTLGDEIDLEWSKKLLRRVVIRPRLTREVHLNLQAALKIFRLGRERVSCHKPLALSAGKPLYLDRFEK